MVGETGSSGDNEVRPRSKKLLSNRYCMKFSKRRFCHFKGIQEVSRYNKTSDSYRYVHIKASTRAYCYLIIN